MPLMCRYIRMSACRETEAWVVARGCVGTWCFASRLCGGGCLMEAGPVCKQHAPGAAWLASESVVLRAQCCDPAIQPGSMQMVSRSAMCMYSCVCEQRATAAAQNNQTYSQTMVRVYGTRRAKINTNLVPIHNVVNFVLQQVLCHQRRCDVWAPCTGAPMPQHSSRPIPRQATRVLPICLGFQQPCTVGLQQGARTFTMPIVNVVVNTYRGELLTEPLVLRPDWSVLHTHSACTRLHPRHLRPPEPGQRWG